MAPEVVGGHAHLSENADVWSMGMVMWEMLTGRVPFSDMPPTEIVRGLKVGTFAIVLPSSCLEGSVSLEHGRAHH